MSELFTKLATIPQCHRFKEEDDLPGIVFAGHDYMTTIAALLKEGGWLWKFTSTTTFQQVIVADVAVDVDCQQRSVADYDNVKQAHQESCPILGPIYRKLLSWSVLRQIMQSSQRH